jgi:hypothetical protein
VVDEVLLTVASHSEGIRRTETSPELHYVVR